MLDLVDVLVWPAQAVVEQGQCPVGGLMVRVPVLHSAAGGLDEAGEEPGGERRVGEIQLVQGLEEWAVVLLVKLADPLAALVGEVGAGEGGGCAHTDAFLARSSPCCRQLSLAARSR
jgi:hypothetical protein